MTGFRALFGIEKSQIKKNCILLPLVPKGALDLFGAKGFVKGHLYACANTEESTLIYTGMHLGLLGDAVLYLKASACRNILLFGSCGLLNKKSGLSVGSLVTPTKSYACESFSDMLEGKISLRYFCPEKQILNKLIAAIDEVPVTKVTCVTISSLKMEAQRAPLLVKKGMDVADMESSAFFSAAGYAGLKAAALFYIADIINKGQFYPKDDAALKSNLSHAINNSISLMRKFMRK